VCGTGEVARPVLALVDTDTWHRAQAVLLTRFRDELAAIDASDDHVRKRAFIEAYVR